MAVCFNSTVIPKDFEVTDLVLRRVDMGQNGSQGKLGPNKEAPTKPL